jgi:hypothetical protein
MGFVCLGRIFRVRGIFVVRGICVVHGIEIPRGFSAVPFSRARARTRVRGGDSGVFPKRFPAVKNGGLFPSVPLRGTAHGWMKALGLPFKLCLMLVS